MGRVTPLLTSQKVLDIIYATPQETLLDTPETLPTSEPANPQISYTVANADLPTLSLTPKSKKWCAVVFAAGKFVTAGTLNYKSLKNGVQVEASSGSVSANTFYTKGMRFYDVAVGDTLAVKLWSSVSDSNWDYKALHVTVSRIILPLPRLLWQLQITASSLPTLTLGNPVKGFRSDLNLYVEDLRAAWAPTAYPATKTFSSLYMGDIYGIYQIGTGDYSTGGLRTHSSYRPYYEHNVTPTKLVLRGIRL